MEFQPLEELASHQEVNVGQHLVPYGETNYWALNTNTANTKGIVVSSEIVGTDVSFTNGYLQLENNAEVKFTRSDFASQYWNFTI